jgi:hypothetical protein
MECDRVKPFLDRGTNEPSDVEERFGPNPIVLEDEDAAGALDDVDAVRLGCRRGHVDGTFQLLGDGL